jgi:predicted nucleic acid-binding protein
MRVLYLDTSALVKRYVQEAQSDRVARLLEGEVLAGTVILAQAEMASALSKAVRLGWLSTAEAGRAWQDFLSHWAFYVRLPVTGALTRRAADLSWRYGLRAYDAVHLAGALTWSEMLGAGILFVSFDQQLVRAAEQEGLLCWAPGSRAGSIG